MVNTQTERGGRSSFTSGDESDFVEEMIQVGAVACVIVEDADTPSTDGRYTDLAQRHIKNERERQIEKWGPQTQTPPVWMLILMEEVGEAADELNWSVIDDLDLRNLMQSIGSLGAASKAYLEMKFGWD